MKRLALIALASFLGSTVLANAITVAPQSASSGVQLVMEKDKMKDEKMSKDTMKKDSMKKEDKMMKKDEMKKDEMKK
jgi:pentapeptide MXKDX repeat protein